MNRTQPSGDDVLQANHALRVWAAGLREWSRNTREASTVERRRAHALRPDPGLPQPPADHTSSLVARLPSLGTVEVGELITALTTAHGLGVEEARSAVAFGLFVAGYPADYDHISAADAFDVMEHVTRRRD